MRLVYVALFMLMTAMLTGCAQFNALGVEPDENALACIKGSTLPFPGIGGSGVMIDAGNTDTTNYTAEDWKALAEICD